MNVIDISKHQNTFAAATAKAGGVEGVIQRRNCFYRQPNLD